MKINQNQFGYHGCSQKTVATASFFIIDVCIAYFAN